MRRKLIFILVISIGTMLSIQSASAAHPRDEVIKGKDSIEWVAFSSFPKTREERLERMVTTELQRRTLWALQEKRYLKTGKEYVYWFDPFQVTDMREIEYFRINYIQEFLEEESHLSSRNERDYT